MSKTEKEAGIRVPNPEVSDRAKRRRFTAAYKLSVLRELDSCTESGEIGAVLRREGLYSSHIAKWRDKRAAGELQALEPRKRGRRARARHPLEAEVARLEREKAKLAEELRKAKLIISVQKKLATLLGIPASELPEESE